MSDCITDEILNYVKDDSASAQFAICLYGEWGSGKTYYCENVLAPELEKSGYLMLRVSMFGVGTSEELYNRILSALCHVNGPRMQKIAESVSGGLLSILGSHGIRLDGAGEAIVSAMALEKALIVLDDTERSRFPKEKDDLLGIVNDMVENNKWHIMMVRNMPFDLVNKDSEKVISRQFEYQPTAETIYDAATAKDHLPENLDFSLRDAIVSAIESSDKLNARALMRALPTIKRVAESEVMRSKQIAAEGRRQALIDAARFCLVIGAGSTLSKPERKTKAGQDIDMDYALASMEWDRYQALSKIVDPIGTGQLASSNVIGECLSAYITKEYPESPADMEAKAIEDKMPQLYSLDDSEVREIAQNLSSVILKHEFSTQWLYKIWTINRLLRELGFDEALSPDDAKHCYRKIIDENPMAAYEVLNGQYTTWLGTEGTERDADLDELCQYATDSIKRLKGGERELSPSESIDGESGKRLADEMQTRLNEPLTTLTLIPPTYVAECFFQGNGNSQYELHRFFRGVLGSQFGRVSDSAPFSEWLFDIARELKSRKANSRMGTVRQKWLISDVSDISEKVESLRRAASRDKDHD